MTIRINKTVHLILAALSFMLFLYSCSSTKYLKEGETFLKSREVNIESNEKIDNKYLFETSLKNQILQKPNGNWFFLFPRENIYLRNADPGDSSWYNNYFRNNIGEPPSIYSKELTERSVQTMQNYLVNKKGYYNAKVDYETETIRHNTKVSYNIDLGDRYKINSVEYFGNDKRALEAMESVRSETLLKKGDPIDAGTFDLELTRISLALQNKGFANFATSFFSIKGDSSLNRNAVDVFLEIRPPLPDSIHQRYTIGDVNVYTDFHQNQDITRLETFELKNKNFFKQSDKFLVRPATLSNVIFLKPGQLYSREDRIRTNRKLTELGTYQFVTLNARLDEQLDSIINYDIFLIPFKNKWVSDIGADIFFSSVNQSATQQGQNRNIFGTSINGQLRDRNFLGGAEQFTINGDVGAEIQLNDFSVRTFTAGVNAALEIPRQRDLFRLGTTLRNLGLFSKERYRIFNENTTTTIAGGINYVNIFDTYSRTSFNTSYAYNYRPTKNKRITIRQTGLEYNDYELKEAFRDTIQNNPLLLNSFEDNLLTGLFFRDISYVYNSPVNQEGNSYTFIGSAEVSGWEKYLVNQAYNALSGSSDIWRLNNNISFAKYFRFELDARFYEYFSKKHHFAARAYAGIILPYGGAEAAPYSKQFSVGGPNSIRGWDQKELGPGGYSERLLNPQDGQTFFQTGDLKLEANIEYRFDLFWYLEGAFFMDAGNTWLLREDSRENSNFTSDWTKQIAVSAGYGFRFDFEYFIIRFDFGYKLRNPFPDSDTNKYWYTWDQIRAQNFGNFQVAVNYPF